MFWLRKSTVYLPYTLSNTHPMGRVLGEQGIVSILRCHLTSIGIPMLKIRRSNDRLIFNMGIPVPGERRSFYWDGDLDSVVRRAYYTAYRLGLTYSVRLRVTTFYPIVLYVDRKTTHSLHGIYNQIHSYQSCLTNIMASSQNWSEHDIIWDVITHSRPMCSRGLGTRLKLVGMDELLNCIIT